MPEISAKGRIGYGNPGTVTDNNQAHELSTTQRGRPRADKEHDT
jgi:hypothetical protein